MDGAIRIETQINTKQAQVQLDSLRNSMVKTADKIASLRAKMDSLAYAKIPTSEYKKLEVDAASLEKKLLSVYDRQEKFLETGGKESSSAYQKMTFDAEQLETKLRAVEEQMQRLVTEGKDFTIGGATEEYAKMEQQLGYLLKEQDLQNQKHTILVEKINQAGQGYVRMGNKGKEAFNKVGKSAKTAFKNSDNAFKGLNKSFGIGFKNILKYGLGIRSLYALVNKLRAAIKEGFENLYNSKISGFTQQIDELKASLLTMKNAFAAAFAPIVEMVIPYLIKLVEWLTMAIDRVGMFLAAITGQKTYLKAVKQTTEALKKQNKEQNKQLSSLDKLNNLSSSKGGDDDGGAGSMFKEVPVDTKVLDWIKKIKDFLKPVLDYMNKLKDIFLDGFFRGFDDGAEIWAHIFQNLKDIWSIIKRIATDEEVVKAVTEAIEAVVSAISVVAGVAADIISRIIDLITSGIKKFLEDNEQRIKDFIITISGIITEIANMVEDLALAIGTIAEAINSEEAIELYANTIGIVADAFMGLAELDWKLIRDGFNIFSKPIVDNAEGFRDALIDILGFLASITGTIKESVDTTFDELNQMYDEHVKPLFDSIADGLSDLAGKFLEFWNENAKPVLDDMAEDFDSLWKGSIQPAIDSIINLIGQLADLIKAIWTEILYPFLGWILGCIIEILPAIKTIWNLLVDFASFISTNIKNLINILSGLIEFITGVLTGDWEKAFDGLIDIFSGLFSYVQEGVLQMVHLFKDVLLTGLTMLQKRGEIIINAIQSFAAKMADYICENIIKKLSIIKDNFLKFAKEVPRIWLDAWRAMYERLVNIFNNIKSFLANKFEWILDKVGKLKNAFGGIGAGTSFSAGSVPEFNSDNIPGYANGTVIPRTMRQHLAILGDNHKETEVVSPLSTIEQAVTNALAKNGGMGSITIEIPVILNGHEIGRAVQQFDREYLKQNGKHAFA